MGLSIQLWPEKGIGVAAMESHVDEYVPPLDLIVAERVKRSVLAQEDRSMRTNAAHVSKV